ncbi:low-affinity phosphate transporter [Coemansia spiralis]|uniref:Low-affinity phosphate transporter n=2 Tax=Coemansia TaxID=4863 RepID=A0A9W8KYQ4_9FUNG|nr:SPX domain-containing protein [Coemansia spiralis]KAJ1996191.1 low-affinity phosphate transporter [Coemansia umbellata]KAJ2626052.1 low-affinity phosphate transporter [Coemansia sp. RSA 1358]KAJ2678594.1 low-affinity phosphate transporter [Coemansia spiralis]
MKFSSALQFNAVPDWAQYYLDYSGLKKSLYVIERDIIAKTAQQPTQHAVSEENSNLLLPQNQAYAAFVPLLDSELSKVDRFYRRKEAELFAEADDIDRDIAKLDTVPTLERRNSLNFFRKLSNIEPMGTSSAAGAPQVRHASTAQATISMDLHGQSHHPQSSRDQLFSLDIPEEDDSPPIHHGNSLDVDSTAPNNVTNAYIPHEHDDNTRTPSIAAAGGAADRLSAQHPRTSSSHQHRRTASFGDTSSAIRDIRSRSRNLFILLHDLRSYAQLNYTGFSKITKKYDKVTHSDLRNEYMQETVNAAYAFTADAQTSLRERMESITYAFGLASGYSSIDDALRELKRCLREEVVWERNTVWRDMIANERMVNAVGVQSPDLDNIPLEPISPLKPRRITNTQKQLLRISFCVLMFGIVWALPLFDGQEQQRCWAMLVFVSLLWATEALPLHVTALLVPFLTVMLGVMRSPTKSQGHLSAGEASKLVFSAMFSSVVMLLLGGFALAAALSKHDIARMIASWILSRAGTSPKTVLLANMLVATFASMWISNVAAPVLCFSLIRPILRTLPNSSTFAPCLIIGIALASNVGGMASPISSPQNIIAINTMHPPPSWFQWFAVSIPVCLLCDLGIWTLLLAVYKPHKNTPPIHHTRFTSEKLNRRQIYVCLVTVATILLWCFESSLQSVVGDMGIIAIIPLVLLFGFPKVLGKEDFNNFLWTVVILAMGGIALGRAVDSSGLLYELASRIESIVDGLPVFTVFCVFCALILVCCTFISHTVGSLIILPIVSEVGARLPEPHSRLLVMGTALMASGAMGLPVSGFPNMNAIMLEDTLGNPYLTTVDFFKTGIPSSLVAYAVIITVGYFVMLLLGF